jgi:hypothetical protein
MTVDNGPFRSISLGFDLQRIALMGDRPLTRLRHALNPAPVNCH